MKRPIFDYQRGPPTPEPGEGGPGIQGTRDDPGRMPPCSLGDLVPAGDGPHEENVPSTSLSRVEAVLPVIVVSSMVAVPRIAMPPPSPTPADPATPAVPGVFVPPDAGALEGLPGARKRGRS
jgi:hypothetical protein